MEYNKLVAVTGMPGLYELVNSKGDGAIVRSLEDNSTKFASSRIHNFSHLESIEIYTTGENVNLVEIFYAMENAGGNVPDGKDNGALTKYFEKVYPDLDFERVYASDLKKMVKWYDILKKNKIEIKLTEPVEEPEVEEPVEEEKPVKAKKESASASTNAASDKKATASKPEAKKASTKEEPKPAAKKAAEKEEKPAAKKKAATKDSKEKKVEKKEAPAKKKAAPKKKK